MSEPAASLYAGQTVHERRAPFEHRFRYRVAMMMIDLDRLEDADRMSALFSVGRFNLFGFRERDHGPRDGSPLRPWADARLAEAGVQTEGCRIALLCSPRVLGYVFNPISIYFAQGPDGAFRGAIYQVHNTFGDDHAYVARLDGGQPHRHGADKAFHVSPFFDVSGRYAFTLREPGERFALSIEKQRADGTDFLATMSLKRRPMTTGALAGLFASQPFFTLKTIAAIHFEALRLWLKGARYHRRPEPPDRASVAEIAR
jgi:uncharacterized protein